MLTIRISEDDLKALVYLAILDHCDNNIGKNPRLPEIFGSEVERFSYRVTDDLIERMRTRDNYTK